MTPNVSLIDEEPGLITWRCSEYIKKQINFEELLLGEERFDFTISTRREAKQLDLQDKLVARLKFLAFSFGSEERFENWVDREAEATRSRRYFYFM